MARVERGSRRPRAQRLIDSAPPEYKALVRFMARAVRAVRIMDHARERAVEQVEALMQRALTSGDGRAAIEAVRAIVQGRLLDELPQPKLVGCNIGAARPTLR